MDKYFFIYIKELGFYDSTTDPELIAKHTFCRAVSKEKVLKKFDSLQELLRNLNGWTLNEKTKEFVDKTDLFEIY